MSRGCPGHPRVNENWYCVQGKQDSNTRSERKEPYDHVESRIPTLWASDDIVLVIVFFVIWTSFWLWYLFVYNLGIVLVVSFVFNLDNDLVVTCLQFGHRSGCDIYLDLDIALVICDIRLQFGHRSGCDIVYSMGIVLAVTFTTIWASIWLWYSLTVWSSFWLWHSFTIWTSFWLWLSLRFGHCSTFRYFRFRHIVFFLHGFHSEWVCVVPSMVVMCVD